MARSRIRPATKGKAVNKNVWSKIKYTADDPDAPFSVGQILHVYPQATEQWIPCMPKPGTNTTITRLPRQAAITFLGMVELIGNAKLMHFLYEEKQVLLGLGCLPHLDNIPKRPTAGFNARPKRGTRSKKSPSRLAKLQAKKRAEARKLNGNK